MYVFKNKIRKIILMLGIILWIGALSPEIFIKSGEGCIFDESGRELSFEEAKDFMEAYFYDNMNSKKVKIKYKIALFDF